jgi:hypothetical protein
MTRHTMPEDRARARQAGTTRAARRMQRMQQRLLAATAPEQALSAAFDWFRSSAGYLARRDGGRHRADADRAMREMASALARSAAAIDEGNHDSA